MYIYIYTLYIYIYIPPVPSPGASLSPLRPSHNLIYCNVISHNIVYNII